MVSKRSWLNKVTLPLLALLLVFTGMIGNNLGSVPAAHADAKLSNCAKSKSGAVATGTCNYSSDGLTPYPPTVNTQTGIIPGGSGNGKGKSHFLPCNSWNSSYNSGTGYVGSTKYPVPPEVGNAACPSYAGTFRRAADKMPTDVPDGTPSIVNCNISNGVSASDIYSWTDGVWHQDTTKGNWYLQWWSSCVYPSRQDARADRSELNSQGYCLTRGSYTIYYGGASAINGKTGGTQYKPAETVTTDFKYNDDFKKNGPSKANPCPTDLKIEWKGDEAPVYKTGPNAGQPRYGFYRITVAAKARYCQKVIPKEWQHQPSFYECDPETDAPNAYYRYTYTCLVKGLYEAKGNPEQVVAGDAQYFDVTNCVGPHVCKADGTQIAGKSYAASNGAADVTVMRNGKQVPVVFGGINLSGTGAKNITNVEVTNRNTTVVPGSSPYYTGHDVTDKNQPFKVYRDNQALPYGENYTVDFPDKSKYGVAFWLASNPGGKWQIQSSYLYKANFHVYEQDTWTGAPHKVTFTRTGQPCDNGKGAVSYSNSARVVVARGVNSN
jgi:hypothetical protein